MKKHYTTQLHSKKKNSNQEHSQAPSETTLDMIRQFARVYAVEKNENGTMVNLFLN